MLTVDSVVTELRKKGSEKTRATMIRHGSVPELTLGVSVADMKTIAKGLKGQQELALGLYATRFMEAMYLAGMVANGAKMSKAELNSWAEGTSGIQMIAEYSVPWVTVENEHGREMALKWMKSKTPYVATSGWCSYSGLVATTADDQLDLGEVEGLLNTVAKEIHKAPNRVRYTMNGFVISTGSYVSPLTKKAKEVAKAIGKVTVDVGDTACEVPDAIAYMKKLEDRGKFGVKKKTIRC